MLARRRLADTLWCVSFCFGMVWGRLWAMGDGRAIRDRHRDSRITLGFLAMGDLFPSLAARGEVLWEVIFFWVIRYLVWWGRSWPSDATLFVTF
jgi:hypothetical protein